MSLLVSRRLLILQLFSGGTKALLDVKARAVPFLMGKFGVQELTEDVVQFLSG